MRLRVDRNPDIAQDSGSTHRARTTQWMERCGFGHHGQSCLCEQLYPCRISAVPAANSVGLGKHAVLAQIHQMKVDRMKIQ
jgi:hypothetical protein